MNMEIVLKEKMNKDKVNSEISLPKIVIFSIIISYQNSCNY